METFIASSLLVAVAETGAQTRLASIALGARYEWVWAVMAGTRLGMTIANVPAVRLGEMLSERLGMDLVRRIAAGLFLLTALLALLGPG